MQTTATLTILAVMYGIVSFVAMSSEAALKNGQSIVLHGVPMMPISHGGVKRRPKSASPQINVACAGKWLCKMAQKLAYTVQMDANKKRIGNE